MTTFDASQILWNNNIRSAPVWDNSEAKYIGFFETRDILGAVIAATKALQQMNGIGVDVENATEEKVFKEAVTNHINDINATESLRVSLPSFAAKYPFHSFSPESALIDMCPHLWGNGNHRVPILDDNLDGKCINIISRTDLVRFLSSHLSDSTSMNEKICDTALKYRKDVVKVNDEMNALEAFEIIHNKNLSGVAVVDDDDVLIGNSSASDIKLATSDRGREASLDMDILSYLASVRQSNANTRFPSAHVYEDATVGQVINKMAKTGYHRMFVTDKDKHPVGVISVGDIIEFALNGT